MYPEKILNLKTAHRLTFIISFLFLCGALYSQWTESVCGNNNWLIASVLFTDPQTGYVSAVDKDLNCTVYRSENGGESWENNFQLPPQKFLTCLFFPDNLTGFGIGSPGTFVKTTNSGISWDLINTQMEGQYGSLYFLDSQTGFAAGGNEKGNKGFISVTSNGGMNWNIIYREGYGYYCVYFTDSKTGYVSGNGGIVLKSTDAGSSWNRIYSAGLYSLTCIRFIDINTGFIFGGNAAGSKGIILKTTDAGLSWVKKDAPAALNSAYFINSTTGYAAGNSGMIIHTTDGGENWDVMPSGTNNILLSVHFIDENRGFITGNNGVFLKTGSKGK